MSAKHTQGHMKPGVSLVGGVEHFTVVPHGSEQTVVAMCGLVGAKDEPESIANTRRIAASLNALEDEDTSMLEAIVREGTTVRKRHNEALSRAEQYQRELCEVEAQRDTLLAALRRLESAAQCRDNTMGDQCRLIEVKAELAQSAKNAREVIKQVEAAL